MSQLPTMIPEQMKQLFDDYKPIELEIWHTFTDTNLKAILAM